MGADILFSQESSVGLITLNRPTALNALTFPMIMALQDQLQGWKFDPSIHAVVIQAPPGNAFCAGGDVRWLYHTGKSSTTEQLQFFWHEYRLNHFIHHLGKPYIALMDGITMGGGVGISMHGSHPVASEQFIFSMPETGIGFFPDIGASHLLTKCPNHLGIYLGLTGARLDPWQSKEAGLVKHLVSSNQMPDLLHSLFQEDLSQDAFARVDECLKSYAMPIKSEPSPPDGRILECFAKKTVEEIQDELKQSNTPLAPKTYDLLEKKSPLSLKITLEQLHQAQGKSLAHCLQMDYDLVQHFIKDPDFYEGVRALLIDKDKNPRWNPATLDEIAQNKVKSYFERTSELQFIT